MKSKCKSPGILTLGMFLTIVCLMPFLVSAETPPGWKTECVGYYQLALPGEVEVALTNPDASESWGTTGADYHFTDGSRAVDSRLYIGNIGDLLLVSSLQPPDAFNRVKRKAEIGTEKYKKKLIAGGRSDAVKRIRPYPVSMPNTFGWLYDGSGGDIYSRNYSSGGADIHMQRGGRIYFYGFQLPGSPKKESGALLVDQFIKRFRTRDLFEIPPETGLCIPYGFIATDDGKKGRSIAITFRLKAHPDVDIFFSDIRAKIPYKIDDKTLHDETKKEIEDFWSDSSNIRDYKQVVLDQPKFRVIELAGQPGYATLGTITRLYDDTDFGYVAYAQGNYDAEKKEKNTQNLMLYVIRTAAHTRGTPMSKKELLKLAEQIAASVKRRVPE